MAIAFIHCERVMALCGLARTPTLLCQGLTYAGSGGESSRDGAGCASSSRWRRCCRSWWTCSSPCSCRPPPPPALTSDPWSPSPCSDYGAYPVDRFGFGAAAAHAAGQTPSRPRRALLRRPGVLGEVRGERCKRGKGGGRGG